MAVVEHLHPKAPVVHDHKLLQEENGNHAVIFWETHYTFLQGECPNYWLTMLQDLKLIFTTELSNWASAQKKRELMRLIRSTESPKEWDALTRILKVHKEEGRALDPAVELALIGKFYCTFIISFIH